MKLLHIAIPLSLCLACSSPGDKPRDNQQDISKEETSAPKVEERFHPGSLDAKAEAVILDDNWTLEIAWVPEKSGEVIQEYREGGTLYRNRYRNYEFVFRIYEGEEIINEYSINKAGLPNLEDIENSKAYQLSRARLVKFHVESQAAEIAMDLCVPDSDDCWIYSFLMLPNGVIDIGFEYMAMNGE